MLWTVFPSIIRSLVLYRQQKVYVIQVTLLGSSQHHLYATYLLIF